MSLAAFLSLCAAAVFTAGATLGNNKPIAWVGLGFAVVAAGIAILR